MTKLQLSSGKSKIRPIETRTKFVILMHPMEFKKEKVGTGRLTHLSLPNSEIIMGVDFTHNEQVNNYINSADYNVSILYPEMRGTSVFTNEKERSSLKPDLIFLIDGTWPCAKKMMRASKNLHYLKRITINPTAASHFAIKQQPHAMCLSTIEATALLLESLVENKKEQLSATAQKHLNYLPTLLDEIVKIQIECVTNPHLKHYRRGSGHFKAKEARKPSKKWDTRSIFYLGD